MSDDSFKRYLSSFLTDYLPRTRGLSPNTILSYRDSFVLLLRYVRDELKISLENVDFTLLGKATIEGFLAWLMDTRGSSARTCNGRLTAIRSFYRYVGSVAPELLVQVSGVLSIKDKKAVPSQITYLSLDSIKLLFAEAESMSLRVLAILSLLYDSAARVQELCDLRQSDLHLEKPASVQLIGKGNKARVVPLSPQVARIMKKYVSDNPAEDTNAALFTNNRGEPIGRAGIAYILKTCAVAVNEKTPGSLPQKVTPHILRHSKSVHLLEGGVNLIYIRDYLGHSSVVTTEVYAKASPELMRRAIEKAGSNVIRSSRYSAKEKKDLLDWLKENF